MLLIIMIICLVQKETIMFNSNNPHQEVRSLLQKAVRRGQSMMVEVCIDYLIQTGDMGWLYKRAFIIVEEECWPLLKNLKLEKDENNIKGVLLEVARSVKNRDAAGLGVLGYNYFINNKTLPKELKSQNYIKKIKNALVEPDKFWRISQKKAKTDEQILIVKKAHCCFTLASFGWDKAFAIAAAVLVLNDDYPAIRHISKKVDLPLWIAIDKHTMAGKRAIGAAAKEIGIKSIVARWISFYCESVKSNKSENSIWWQQEVNWRLSNQGLNLLQAEKLWKELKPLIIQNLSQESNTLRVKLKLNPEHSNEPEKEKNNVK